jgi:hypothetical protein
VPYPIFDFADIIEERASKENFEKQLSSPYKSR